MNFFQEYLLGNKKQSVIPVAFSLVANFASSISILGYTSEVYNYGTHFFVINVAYMISTPVAVIFYLPVIMKNNTISVYEVILNFLVALLIVCKIYNMKILIFSFNVDGSICVNLY